MIRIPGTLSLCFALLAGIHIAPAQSSGNRPAAKPAVTIANKKALEHVTEDRFRGKWQEIKRRRLDNGEYLAFKDTLLIDVQETETIIKETGLAGQTLRGILEIAGNDVNIAGKTFTVGNISNEEWLLYEENAERTLVAVPDFANDRTISVKASDYGKGAAPELKNLEGSWTIYRREGRGESINADSYIIEHLSLDPSTKKDEITGYIRFTEKNTPVTMDCRIVFTGDPGHFILEAGSHSWDMYHFSGDGKEWLFGNSSEVIYRARR